MLDTPLMLWEMNLTKQRYCVRAECHGWVPMTEVAGTFGCEPLECAFQAAPLPMQGFLIRLPAVQCYSIRISRTLSYVRLVRPHAAARTASAAVALNDVSLVTGPMVASLRASPPAGEGTQLRRNRGCCAKCVRQPDSPAAFALVRCQINVRKKSCLTLGPLRTRVGPN